MDNTSQACECQFRTHHAKGCPGAATVRCAGCGRQLCGDCSLDQEHCSRCYRELYGTRPLQVGGQVRKHPQWKWRAHE